MKLFKSIINLKNNKIVIRKKKNAEELRGKKPGIEKSLGFKTRHQKIIKKTLFLIQIIFLNIKI